MKPLRLLFLCVANAGRSQMAAAIATVLGGSGVEVVSGGSDPAEAVLPDVRKALAELGISIGQERPRRFTEVDVRAADVVVTMGCGEACPIVPGVRYLDWQIDDPGQRDLAGVRTIRDELHRKVAELLRELGALPGGPLHGVRVVEITALGPAPFCGMLFSNLGADVLRIDRLGSPAFNQLSQDVLLQGRPRVGVDLKHAQGPEVVLRLVEQADALIEGFRPGVAERLGIGPEPCLTRNPRLVYGRMTGWGGSGPLAERAGHDINFLALSGVLAAIGEAGGPPVIPLNLVADFGGGAMYLAMGMLAALWEAGRSGRGQVVEASMVEGVNALTTLVRGLASQGLWNGPRGTNLLDGGAPFYSVYETSDQQHVAVGALEPNFFATLIEGLGLNPAELDRQYHQDHWPQLRQQMAEVIRTRTRAQWEAVFEGKDACLTPVLTLAEVPGHAHFAARRSFIERSGVEVAGPTPRFTRTPAAFGPEHEGEGLAGWGFSPEQIAALEEAGVLD